MPILSVVIEGAIGWAVGRMGNVAADAFRSQWCETGAKVELIAIIEDAMENAVAAVPVLAEDFRSETFIHHVVAPAVLQFLRDPTTDKPDGEIVQGYIERFVEPFLRGRSLEKTLSQLFRTQRPALEIAFSLFLTRLRPALYASKHWREPIRDQALEEIRSTVLRIEKQLAPTSVFNTVDIDVARADAKVASEALKSWTQTIGGERIDRPELEVLQQRIREHPYACTLVIGESGSGKSALFAELTSRLQKQGMVVFAIKADLLPTHVKTLDDVSAALGLHGHLLSEIEALARTAPVVVLIDQLDAVSEVMDRSSERMRLMLQIAHHFQDKKQTEPPVHILVSSRPFEADYDARFQSLYAETIQLALPSHEQVQALLHRLHIPQKEIPATLSETLRRPFALRIFVDILRCGVPGSELVASQLLNTWLISANLGDSAMRQTVLTFLETLAVDMTQTESLWRPVDTYETQDPQAVQVAVASGIAVRQNGLVGFSHQAWLDDFQVKNFTSGQSLANYAWQRQGGLFARATVLRALQRLRTFDLPAYTSAIDALLGDARTRRHLRHLVVDMVAGQRQPSERERTWLQQLVHSDAPLARRALTRATAHWVDWREYLRPLTTVIMGNPDLRWSAIQMLITEAPFDADFVVKSISAIWDSPDRDLDVFYVFSNSSQWSPASVERLQLIFSRQKSGDYAIVKYAQALSDNHAADLLKIYLEGLDINDNDQLQLYGLDKLIERSSKTFASTLLPWFVRVAGQKKDESQGHRNAYPCSTSLPSSWDYAVSEDGIFEVARSVVLACAKEHPRHFLSLISPFLDTEVDEVQALIAEGFAAGNTALANEGVEYLLADPRRLQLGMAFVQDAHGVSQLVTGWSTETLLRAIVPQVDAKQLERLRLSIESWEPYMVEALGETDAPMRLQYRLWAQERRLSLLALLPTGVLEPRRYRQVQEWLSKQPILRRDRGKMMASFVGSPMSVQQMTRASDKDIFKLIDEVADTTDRRPRSRRLHLDGGIVELARAFAAFAKIHPERALCIAEHHFQPNRHENAAGELLRALADNPSVNTQHIRALIWKWHREGFASKIWRRDTAWALQHLAKRGAGLIDEDLALLETWIVNDSKCIETQIAQRISLEKHNRKASSARSTQTKAIVFGQNPGGMRVLPQDNFSLLSAMAAGLLSRKEPDWDGWLSALERHVDRAEDPAIWTALLMFRGQPLYWANRPRTTRLLQTVWERFPDAFSNEYIGDFLWSNRELVADEMMKAIRDWWLASDKSESRQAAGELLMATVLLNPENKAAALQLEQVLAGSASPERLGILFTASTAWREDAPTLRHAAHRILMRFVQQASGHDASAIACIVPYQEAPIGDSLTKEMFGAIAGNPAVLSACFGRNFTHILQALLLYPGFEELVLELTERCADLMFAKGESSLGIPHGESFVAIAISLQRSTDSLRSRAMDLYERLLDGAVYGAEEAAAASLMRG
ncbi:ATP-binding protein [Paenalcaligenes niemegkensis]|uniref:AAA family ATPase n=1 Tax=Paenalcaligenes niemegkensis TaxID=2895469 RepID=UPI001EE926D3|nr:ATP-binding protein [Paenalcaligenes niemegkensis]MCQ9616406.1 ATP-binding protein [Paenalcaligenes niemegkensis]